MLDITYFSNESPPPKKGTVVGKISTVSSFVSEHFTISYDHRLLLRANVYMLKCSICFVVKRRNCQK